MAPDTRSHRSAGPRDAELFAAVREPALAEAAEHLSWLLSRDYGDRSSLELVGNRLALTSRQRDAVARSACAEAARIERGAKRARREEVAGRALLIDGYNVLTTVEVALGGGVVLLGRDGCLRDVASLHGTWRRVAETAPPVDLIGRTLAELDAGPCTWLLDRPVSNSGRLAELIRERASEGGWSWSVELEDRVDARLVASEEVVASADSRVLDGCRRWLNLARRAVETQVPRAWLLDLSGSGEPEEGRSNRPRAR